MIRDTKNGVIADFKVIPRSSRNKAEIQDGLIRLKVTAAPVDGKANEVIIKYLSDILSAPKSKISILRGKTCRQKTIEISDMDKESFLKKIAAFK